MEETISPCMLFYSCNIILKCEFLTTSMSCRNLQEQSSQLHENKTVKNPLDDHFGEILVLLTNEHIQYIKFIILVVYPKSFKGNDLPNFPSKFCGSNHFPFVINGVEQVLCVFMD